MERVETLFNVLTDKMLNNPSIDDLIIIVRMMESELLHLKNIDPNKKNIDAQAAILSIVKNESHTPSFEENILEADKIIEVLKVDEDEINAELEEIKNNIESNNIAALRSKPVFRIDDEKGVVERNETHKNEFNATIENAKELNEVILIESFSIINDEHKGETHEIIDALKVAPILDLKKAIGVNERFLYLNELFRGDENMYNKSIKAINSFSSFTEAELWMQRELFLRLGWDENYSTVKQFYSLVKRRFS